MQNACDRFSSSPFRCIVHFCESERKSLQRNFVFFFCYFFYCFYKLFCLQSYFSFFALSVFSRVVLPPYALKYVCVCSIHAFNSTETFISCLYACSLAIHYILSYVCSTKFRQCKQIASNAKKNFRCISHTKRVIGLCR